jgi:hypothetical protein
MPEPRREHPPDGVWLFLGQRATSAAAPAPSHRAEQVARGSLGSGV